MIAQPDKKPRRRRVKKVKGHAAHHGGAWKVAYADFVTAMMALFLVLWLVSQADTKVKQAIANYFRSPGVFEQSAGGILNGPKKVSKDPSTLTSKDDDQTLFNLSSTLKKKFDTRPEFSKSKDQIKIEMTEDGVKIQILEKADHVSFDSGSASLTPDTRAILAEIAQAICQLPNPLIIGGHTDRHLFPPDSVYTNWELSADRANAARRQLESSCVKPEQIRRIIGYGDSDPLIPEDPYAVANRRISIVVMRIARTGSAEDSDGARKPPDDGKVINIQDPAAKPDTTASPQAPNGTNSRGLKSVSVGGADEVPRNVKVSKEQAKPTAAAPEH